MKEKVCFVVSSSMTINAFLQQPIKRLSGCYDVYIALNINQNESLSGLEGLVTILPVGIERKISPWRDFLALWQLVRIFHQNQFKLVHSVTPKAGLLAMLAAFLVGVDIRIHTFTGQVWATRTGFSRWLLKCMDRLIGQLATATLVDSASQRQFLLDEGVLSPVRSGVLADGSISGVDTGRFKPNIEARNRIRSELQIPDGDTVFLFIGRLNRDKGLLDLAAAFSKINNTHVHLLMVGPDEERIRSQIEQMTSGCGKRVHFVDFAIRPEEYMAAADVLCLPSYREGFGNVVIEAASVGIPAIGSRIYGIEDAIAENQTGLLFEVRNVNALQVCMERLINDSDLRKLLGKQALERVRVKYTSERLATAWLDYYQANL